MSLILPKYLVLKYITPIYHKPDSVRCINFTGYPKVLSGFDSDNFTTQTQFECKLHIFTHNIPTLP